LGFIRTGIASPIGDAIYTRAMSGVLSKHHALFGENAVGANNFLPLQYTLQELYGYSVILGVITLIILAGSHFRKQVGMPMPTFVRMYKIFTKQ
jgi:hypothetical protein